MPLSRQPEHTRNEPCNRHAALDEQDAGVVSPPCSLCNEQQSSAHFSFPRKPQQQQQQQQRYLPKTTAHTATTAASSFSSIASSTIEQEICPVTGVFANISDDYYINPEVIGKGRRGVVRECMHLATRQTLAVKSIDKSKVNTKPKIGELDRLQAEIYVLANVHHRGIMKMVDCYEDAEFVHIIMEKYTGGELFDQIVANTNSTGCLSERRAAGIIKQLLEAVAYLHENGVVHRDIKPENIMFESKRDDAAIKLIDFGLSKRHENSEGPMYNPVGTPYYMSPELLKGRYDKSCDIWAVGIVAYILLAGYPPFNGSNDLGIQDSIRRGRLRFLGARWLSKSDDAMDFIKRLLRRDPKKRVTAKDALMHAWIKNMMIPT